MMGVAQVFIGILTVIGSALCQEKRVLLHSEADILQKFSLLEQRFQVLETENAQLRTNRGKSRS